MNKKAIDHAKIAAEQYSVGINAICDTLDRIPLRVKMACPDIPQAAINVIVAELIEARKKAIQNLDNLWTD